MHLADSAFELDAFAANGEIDARLALMKRRAQVFLQGELFARNLLIAPMPGPRAYCA